MEIDCCKTPEATITMLKECIDSINAGVFEGIVIVSKGVETGCWINKGTVGQRISIVDLMFTIMYKMQKIKPETNVPGWQFFMEEMYKRFRFYFASTYEDEILKANEEKDVE